MCFAAGWQMPVELQKEKEQQEEEEEAAALTQHQRGPAGDPCLQALVENLVQKHDRFTGRGTKTGLSQTENRQMNKR